MKKRKYKIPVTFFTTESMYNTLKEISDNEREIGLSELLREIIDNYLSQDEGKESKDEN
ncbi:hypothetical protein ACFL5P_00380 [candidate division KSB1 bacterium]